MYMTTKILHIENSKEAFEAYEKIENTFPCWIDAIPIEMNYSEVIIRARAEDMASIEKILAPFV